MSTTARFVAVVLCVALLATVVSAQARYKDFLKHNVDPNNKMPLSYSTQPLDYFNKVPNSLKGPKFHHSHFTVPCGRNSTPEEMDAYQFQTEQLISALGLDIYDGAVWSIAMSLFGEHEAVSNYTNNILMKHKTIQLADIRGDKPCAGVMEWGQCSDPLQNGACGLCYGDGPAKSLDADHAYFFSMIGNYWSIQNTVDQRCPEKKLLWTWNTYKPVLGENAWANYLGPLQSAYLRYKGDVNQIDDNSAELTLGANFLTALSLMKVGDTGAIYYAPRNTFFGFSKEDVEIGDSVSVENQASLLAGLKAFRYVVNKKTSSQYKSLIGEVDAYIAGLEKFILSAYHQGAGFFRQGGKYDLKTSTFSWGDPNQPMFATDCQTWVSTAVGPALIDKTFGVNTSFNMWQRTKEITGYKCYFGSCQGVGFANASAFGSVFSGEWTLGMMNWGRVVLNELADTLTADQKSTISGDLDQMQFGIETELGTDHPIGNGTIWYSSITYASHRYWIPFGWWANRLPATASTGWMVAYLMEYNPLMLGGNYTARYADEQW